MSKLAKAGKKIYCVDMERPTGFDNMPLQHGICAFERDSIEAGIKHLMKVLENKTYETCCSTDHIGMMGATFTAEVLVASNEDLSTKIDKTNGHRYFEDLSCFASYVIYDIKDHKPSQQWNDEFVTRNHNLLNLWYKVNASNEEKQAMIDLGKTLGVEVYEVEEPVKIRIEETVEEEHIPVEMEIAEDDFFGMFGANNPVF